MKTCCGKKSKAKILNRGITTHAKKQCDGSKCCFHNPSKHRMVKWNMYVRMDRNTLVERICPHGIGHPDPDSLRWLNEHGVEDGGTHGCDGCCTGRKLRA